MRIWYCGSFYECETSAQVLAVSQFIRLDKQARELASESSEPAAPPGDRSSQIPDLTTLARIGLVA